MTSNLLVRPKIYHDHHLTMDLVGTQRGGGVCGGVSGDVASE